MPKNTFGGQVDISADVRRFLPFLSDEKLSTTVPLALYGANSLDMVEMLTKMEEKYKIRFQFRDLNANNITISNITDMVMQQTLTAELGR